MADPGGRPPTGNPRPATAAVRCDFPIFIMYNTCCTCFERSFFLGTRVLPYIKQQNVWNNLQATVPWLKLNQRLKINILNIQNMYFVCVLHPIRLKCTPIALNSRKQKPKLTDVWLNPFNEFLIPYKNRNFIYTSCSSLLYPSYWYFSPLQKH